MNQVFETETPTDQQEDREDRCTGSYRQAVRFLIIKDYSISKLIKALPKDIAALDKRSVLANVNSQGSVSWGQKEHFHG